MGQGIGGVIPLRFKIEKIDFDRYKKYFSPTYFDFYDLKIKEAYYFFTIKPEQFFPYYGDMLIEFYEAIGVELYKATEIAPESELLKIKTFEQFDELFSHSNRNGWRPSIVDSPYVVSILGCSTDYSWVFYSGSYKAFLEEYSTLLHFERILAKLMKNPLANIIKFGIVG
jgi:hypothetical protein